MRLDEIIQQPGQSERTQQESTITRVRVAVPGKVLRYNADTRCADIQPMIQDGPETPPQLLDVPVYFPGEFTYDINAGDECLVICADNNIDAWWATGQVSRPMTERHHDLSDGFALVGFHSLPNVTPGRNLNDLFEELNRKACGIPGINLYINGNGCLIFEKADGSIYTNELGELIIERPPSPDMTFYLNNDGELIMEVTEPEYCTCEHDENTEVTVNGGTD
jgi:hypothetical protein